MHQAVVGIFDARLNFWDENSSKCNLHFFQNKVTDAFLTFFIPMENLMKIPFWAFPIFEQSFSMDQ